jgi:hypothetical protein
MSNPLYNDGSWQEFRAAAENIQGFTVRTDFMSPVGMYLRRNTIFWPLLKKEAAEADIVREILEEEFPATGFFSKAGNAMNPPENAVGATANDLGDTGQEVKATGGLFKISHYGESLSAQQGRPFGNQVNLKTNNLIVSAGKTLERSLFTGSVATSPLQFNGIGAQMAVDHTYEASVVDGDSVVQKIRAVCRLAVTDEDVTRDITHIFTSGLGLELIEQEMDQKLSYWNLDEVRPGLKVPAIITQSSNQGQPTPLITSPYLTDQAGATEADDDIVDFWLVDMNLLCWKGVIPYGAPGIGLNRFQPQIFELKANSAPHLIDSRLCICYGTLYAKNRGQGIYRLRIRVPNGSSTSI